MNIRFRKHLSTLTAALTLLFLTMGCGSTTTITSELNYPSPDELYMTSGDGNLDEYEPVGQLSYTKIGYPGIGLPIICGFGLFRKEVSQPGQLLQNEVKERAQRMGGDAVLNLDVSYRPPTNACGFAGRVSVSGEVVKLSDKVKSGM